MGTADYIPGKKIRDRSWFHINEIATREEIEWNMQKMNILSLVEGQIEDTTLEPVEQPKELPVQV